MEKVKYYIEKYKTVIICFVIIIVLLCLILKVYAKNNGNKQVNSIEINKEIKEEKNEENNDNKESLLKVDIKGYIEKPGVYELESNSRVIDVINKAGGLKKNANTEYINLSKKISDEMIIIIYSNDDVEKFKEKEQEVIYIKYECECPDNINDACITDESVVNTNGVTNSDTKEDTLVSINNATLDEFMSLSGIGESKAKAIIEYRDKNGEFKNLEELKNVEGIGESVYNKIKDYIKL